MWMIIAESLFESRREIPETEYGYWITDTGKFIPVAYEEHDVTARRNGTTFGHALQDGWIRVMCHDRRFNVSISGGAVGARAISALRDLANSDDYSYFAVDIGQRFNIAGNFSTPRSLMKLISRCTKMAVSNYSSADWAWATGNMFLRDGDI